MALETLITLTDVQLAYGHHPLLDHADFAIQGGERIGLVGRNGAGKSSLLRLLVSACIRGRSVRPRVCGRR